MSTSLCLYVYTFLCARRPGWTQQGLNPQGGPKTSSAWKSWELHPISRQYIAKANPTPARKLAFVMYASLHVCMCACMNVSSMHVCKYACMQVCMHVCTYAGMHICTYAHMHVCTYARIHACAYAGLQVCTFAHIYVCMYACMHICMHAYMHVWMYGWMDASMHIHSRVSSQHKSERVILLF